MGLSNSKEQRQKTKFRKINQNQTVSTVSTEIYSEINEYFSKTIVTQKFKNPLKNPLELQIYILKKENVIFSSFNCKIGDSIKVKSKVIKKEKAEQKYTDAISSGNAAIFVTHAPNDENKIIIHMGNIPPKTEVIFTSEFIRPMEVSKKYEFEFFRNLPIFMGGSYDIFENSELSGTINIKTKNKIINIEKDILMKDLNIINENYEKDNNYIIKYQILKLPSFSWFDSEYIPSSKIYFDLDKNEPISLVQESSFDSNLKAYYIQYRLIKENLNKQNEVISPCLFIFLIDQSGSMSGTRIKIASQALILFLQSLPVGSYYQIIGFGSDYRLYDEIPKKYNKENIRKSIKIIEKLDAKLGGTNIYKPLKHIYDSSKNYDKINLPKSIFLLTDGAINNKKETLELIEKYSSYYRIYSIGIGDSFDTDLIKNAGVIGKGSYNFCSNLGDLNSIVASEINKCCTDFVTDLSINCNLDKNNLINNIIPSFIRENEIINLYYILIKEDNQNEKIKLDIKYKDEEKKIVQKKVEINAEKIENGEDLSKLVIYNYIRTNYNLSNDKKLELALKYQIFTEDTSLFAEVELTNSISEKMKLEILGTKENNLINAISDKNLDQKLNNIFINDLDVSSCCYDMCVDNCMSVEEDSEHLFNMLLNQYNNEKGDKHNKKEYIETKNTVNEAIDIPEKNKKEEIKEINLNNKEHIMKMINTQDFIEGSWEVNIYTKKILEKYIKEYNLIKKLEKKNIDDNTALTILIIYFINKNHPELLKDLLMIIKKAKMFIEKKTKDKYEKIIKELGID